MAHGVAIKAENMDKVIAYANERLSEIQFDVEEVEVDFIFNNANINYDILGK